MFEKPKKRFRQPGCLALESLEKRELLAIVAGLDAGQPPMIHVLDSQTGAELRSFPAFDIRFRGGVHVAMGDVTGDGTADIIAAPGRGGGPQVKVFDGRTGLRLPSPLGSFWAYDRAFTGGVFVASGDVNGDGRDDIITAAGPGGGPQIKVFSGMDGSVITKFFAYDSSFRGGVTVASGDLNGDNIDEIFTAPGSGHAPLVKAFSWERVVRRQFVADSPSPPVLTVSWQAVEKRQFHAYSAAFRGGVFIASGDVNGDGKDDIVTGTGAGGGPQVRAFSGSDGARLASFMAYPSKATGGVRVSVTDVNGDGGADVITAPGAGQALALKAYSLDSIATAIPGFTAEIGLRLGAFVGADAHNDALVPRISVEDIVVMEGSTGTSDAIFSVTLSKPSRSTINVAYATSSGTADSADFEPAAGTLIFEPGQTSRSVTAAVHGDLVHEEDQTFFLNLSQPSRAQISDGQAVATINNDDALPAIATNDSSVTEGNSGSTAAVFQITLSHPSEQSISVSFATGDDTASAADYQSATGILTFVPGETSKSLTVLVQGDVLYEADQSFIVSLTSALNAQVADGQGIGTVVNDDSPPSILIANATVDEGGFAPAAAVFPVTLSGPSEQPVTVSFGTADGTARTNDYQSATGTLVFAPQQTTNFVTVMVNGDSQVEPDETFTLAISDSGALNSLPIQAVGTIRGSGPPATGSLPTSFVDPPAVTPPVVMPASFNANLALHWAPEIHQDVDPDDGFLSSDNPTGKYDFITSVDFDGDWDTLNNWESAEAINDLPAYVYYSVITSETHWFIQYAFYYPRDWMAGELDLETSHENDTEGLVTIVKRPTDGSGGFGEIQAVVTGSHSDFYSYIPQGGFLQDGRETIDGRFAQAGSHPIIQVEAEGHGVQLLEDFPGGDGIRYIPTLNTAESPGLYDGESGPGIQTVKYQLLDIFAPQGLWAHRHSEETFARDDAGNFLPKLRGDNNSLLGGDNAADAPWALDDTGDLGPIPGVRGPDDLPAGAIAYDPARLADLYFSGDHFSRRYVDNPYADSGELPTVPYGTAGHDRVVFFVNGFAGTTWTAENPGPLAGFVVQQGARVGFANWNSLDQTGFPFQDDLFLEEMQGTLDTFDTSDTVILIGYSFGGDSLVKAVNHTGDEIDLLVLLDSVGTGGFRQTVPDNIPSNVQFLYNRWQTGSSLPLPPFDFLSSGQLVNHASNSLAASIGISDQKEISVAGILPHMNVPDDPSIQGELRAILGEMVHWSDMNVRIESDGSRTLILRAGEKDNQVQLSGDHGLVHVNWVGQRSQRFADIHRVMFLGNQFRDVLETDSNFDIPIYAEGGGGNDSLSGGNAGDVLHGGSDNDYLEGGGGEDKLYGEVGYDTLKGGDGTDRLWGGSGDDALQGGNQADFLYGDAGNDALHGDAGNDVLEGGSGDDHLAGGADDDQAWGGLGNDRLRGDAGFDKLFGEDDQDRFEIDFVSNQAGIIDELHGGVERDYVVIVGYDPGQDFDAQGLVVNYSGNDEIILTQQVQTVQARWRDLQNGTAIRTVSVNLPADVEFLAVEGLKGNDAIWAPTLTRNIDLHGGPGDDHLIGGKGHDRLYGDENNDTLEGGDGDDVLHGGIGNDTLKGDRGNNRLYADGGNDKAFGGDGYEVMSGSDEDNTIDVFIAGPDSKGVVVHTYRGNDIVIGSRADDTIHGEGGNDFIFAGGGNDTVYGGQGNDRLFGGGGNDTINGQLDNDSLYGGANKDDLYGDVGQDTLWSDTPFSVSDLLFALDQTEDWTAILEQAEAIDSATSTGLERLDGGEGADELHGSDGNDWLIGGPDDDMLYVSPGADLYVGGDNRDGSPGRDTKMFLGAEQADTIDIRSELDVAGNYIPRVYRQVILPPPAGSEWILVGEVFEPDIERVGVATLGGDDAISVHFGTQNVAEVYVDAGEGTDTIDARGLGIRAELRGGLHDDTIFGGALGDVIEGGDGKDTLNGEAGNDTLRGDAGDDTLDGGSGDDYLDGGLGWDDLLGRTGNDTYYFDDATAGHEREQVYEWPNEGTDTLDFRAVASIVYIDRDAADEIATHPNRLVRTPGDFHSLNFEVWRGARERGETFVTGRSHLYQPPHTRGDRDFDTDDGNPMHIRIIVETRVNGRAIESRVYMRALEHEPDNTTAEGWSSWNTQYSLASDFIIVGANVGSTELYYDIRDENHDVKTVGGSGIVNWYTIYGDRDGDEAGIYTRVIAVLNTIRVQWERIFN